MRFITTFFWLLVFSISSFGQEEKINGAYLSIESDTLNYGEIRINSNGERSIKVVNTGNEPLLINFCKGSCGCTVPKCPNTKILPGDVSAIKIVYETTKVGEFSKTVTIKSNAINNTVYIKIIGKVTP